MPRGANLHTPEQRAADDAKIRSRRHKYSIDPEQQQPEAEQTYEESPIEAERQRGTDAMKAVRAACWQRPVISPTGELVARELGPEFFLDHEDPVVTTAVEAPTYVGWRIVGTSLGPAFQEPGNLPSLIAESELPSEWFIPAGGGGNEAYLVVTKPAD